MYNKKSLILTETIRQWYKNTTVCCTRLNICDYFFASKYNSFVIAETDISELPKSLGVVRPLLTGLVPVCDWWMWVMCEEAWPSVVHSWTVMEKCLAHIPQSATVNTEEQLFSINTMLLYNLNFLNILVDVVDIVNKINFFTISPLCLLINSIMALSFSFING